MMEHDTTLEVFDGAKLEECNRFSEANVILITTKHSMLSDNNGSGFFYFKVCK